MTRWTSATNEATAAEQSIILVIFASLAFPGSPDATQRIHNGVGTLTWGGYDWSGVGHFGGVGEISESLDPIAVPVDLTLSGVDPDWISDAMTTQYHGQDVALYIGMIDRTTGALVATPEMVWDGYMDVMTIEVGAGSAQITLRCENNLRKHPLPSRYTDEDQQLIHPGDTFLSHLHTIGRRGNWGSANVYWGPAPGSAPQRDLGPTERP